MIKFFVLILTAMIMFAFIGCQKGVSAETVVINHVTTENNVDSRMEYYSKLKKIDGVSMRTELDVYAPGTTRIMVYWENNTDSEYIFGESWQLFQKQNSKFISINNTVSGNYYTFPSIGYRIKPGKIYKHIYWLESFTDDIAPGKYKIMTEYSRPGPNIRGYALETEFEVSVDISKWGVSALNYINRDNSDIYSDITGSGWHFLNKAFINSDFRLYKNNQTYDTVLTDGYYEYEIEQGRGKWGVTHNLVYEADEKLYLIYAYSCTIDDKYSSYLNVLDITDKTSVHNIYKSEPIINDYIVNFNENYIKNDDGQDELDEYGDSIVDNKFDVFYDVFSDLDDGGAIHSLGDKIGLLIYENGEFYLECN